MRRLAWMCGLAGLLVSPALAAQPAQPPPPPPAPAEAFPPADPAPGATAPSATPAEPPAAYPAYGEPPPPPPPSGGAGYGAAPEPPPPPRRQRQGVETHDGFYLRFGLGGGSMSSDVTYDTDLLPDATVSGGAFGGHLMLGGTVAKGFVIGASMGGINAVEPKVERAGESRTAKDTTFNLSHLGLLLDWFPDEHGGFHVGGSLGFYSLQIQDDDGSTSDPSTGGGGQLFVGYDFWVGDDWSLGGLLALTHASTEVEELGTKIAASTNAIILQFSVLYH